MNYTKEFIELLKIQTYMSPSTLHKIFNPYCALCMMMRGQRFLKELET